MPSTVLALGPWYHGGMLLSPVHRSTVSLGISLVVASLFSLGLLMVGRLLWSDPSPTFGQASRQVLELLTLGLDRWTAAAYGLGLLVGGIGFLSHHRWGYVLFLALLITGAVLTWNPTWVAGVYLVIRSWSLFFSPDPEVSEVPIEWRQLLLAGLLATLVFGPTLAERSPASHVRTLITSRRPVPGATPAQLTHPPEALALGHARLVAIRQLGIVLQGSRERGDLKSFPVSEPVTPIRSLAASFPPGVADLIDRLPTDALTAYWSNGTSFALYAVLPFPFSHPRTLAVQPPVSHVLVRTEADVDDDLDFDGLPDAVEQQQGTSPVLADTDGDGFSDGLEVGQGQDPRRSAPQPFSR